MKSNVFQKPATKGAKLTKDTASAAMTRFEIKPNICCDLAEWMRDKLTQKELDRLRAGACAFHPVEGLVGATKAVVLNFCNAFADECEGADCGHMHGWKERIADDLEEAAAWSGWTDAERESALLISDAMADHADFDDVNPSACADLIEKPDDLEDYLVKWMESDDKTLVKHARKVARMAGMNLNELI